MKNQTNKNPLILGCILGIIASATLGATLRHDNEVGRFRLETGNNDAAFVIDTVTGQVWSKKRLYNNDQAFLLPKAE